MKVLIDLNVVLDVLSDRAPYAAYSAGVLALAERQRISAYLCATSVVTLHYLVRKELSPLEARRHLGTLLGILRIADVTEGAVRAAYESRWPDLEDAIVYQSAQLAGVRLIVTRDRARFAAGQLPLLSPEELLAAGLSEQGAPTPGDSTEPS